MSEIRTATISDLAGTGPATLTKQSAAKAWVNLNGTGTIAVRDSFNVASLTDNGTGDYTINFSSAFGAADYAPVSGCQSDQASSTNNGNVYGDIARFSNALQTSSARLAWGIGGIASKYDPVAAIATIHGDLA